MNNMKIGFIGAGKMASALARGMLASGKVEITNVIASSPMHNMGLQNNMKALDVNTTHDNVEVVHKSDIIFLAVKPHKIRPVVAEIAPSIDKNKLVISVALGVTLRSIENLLPRNSRVVRVMPNTPVLVRAGASAYSLGTSCQEGDSSIVQELLSTCGYAVEVSEKLVDPVTGLSGSAPSYMFCAIEALADGGVKMGLPRELSIQLAAHTLIGAGKMVLESNKHPAQLKDDVQTPGGSASHAMHHIENSAFRGILIAAVEAACVRSRETGVKIYLEEAEHARE